MPAPARSELDGLVEPRLLDGVLPGNLQPHLVEVVLDRRIFGRCIVYIGAVVVQILNVCAGGRKSLDSAQGIGQIEIPEAVTVVRAVDEYVRAALDEADGVLGLYPGVIVLSEDCADKGAVGSPVHVEAHMVLAAVHNLGVDVLCIRAPGYVCDVAFL